MKEWIGAIILAVVAFYCGFYSGRQCKKKPVDLHLEINRDLLPSQEMLDASRGSSISNFFNKEFFYHMDRLNKED